MKKMTNKDYNKYVEKTMPKSKLIKNIFMAFLIGGIICVIGQLISNYFKSIGLDLEDVSGITSMSMIFLGGLLTGLHVYDKIAKYGGAGTLVPITGFANAIVSPAIEFKNEGYILGIGTKMFAVVGPVLVYGITASIVAGLITFVFRLMIP